jgi:hypothetical protein
MNRASTFWGIVLVVMGSLFLAGSYLGFNAWTFFWPILIILFGVWLMMGSQRRTMVAPDRETVSVPLGDAEKVSMLVRHGAGRLAIHGGACSGCLVEGTFSGGLDHTESRQGSTLQTTMQVPHSVWSNSQFFVGGWAPIDWDMRLTGAVPVALELETGAGESTLDLTDVKAESISVKTGASSTDLTLPAQAGRMRVQVESGASSVRMRIPDGVSARISVESGLAGISVDSVRFPRFGNEYRSADYDTAANRADIHVRTGVGSVDIR